ncbi:hypothetical protein EGI22_14910 [Lacihabitans sp. LS3-19]|uniref:hypothetical protein n=1 Tax=Lacihabitans sp. LS3-19 TaxID=2487335 RepID=UPI0020CEF448|nr:hypothetical protein [Lacihabitans sp. LS3-19]MCP9769206.1 hypothetical protein [Lacihabitans sp. LS3-19]
MVKKLLLPLNYAIDTYPPQYISATNGTIFFQNYDPINNFELWKCDENFQNEELLKNINTITQSSKNYEISAKAGKYWYFSGTDINGTELWKTDGTSGGTKMVKDISPLDQSIRIFEIVAVDTSVIFTATINNLGPKKLFKSDGTEMGTVEINLLNYPNIEPQELILIDSKLFFSGFDINLLRRVLWTYDITNGNINSVTNDQYSPSNKISISNKLIYAADDGLFVSDGTLAGSSQFSGGILSGPTYMKFPVEYNEKILFFSQGAFPTPDFSLYETDGTIAGTNQIKILGDYFMFSSANTLFLTKLNGKLIFSGHLNQNNEGTFLELWSTDGTNENTNKFTELKIENSSPTNINNYNIKYVKNENELFVFVKFYSTNLNKFMFKIYKTDGTNNGTHLILSRTNVDLPYEMTTFDGKIYFSTQNSENGYELWRSDGTSLGTYLIKDLNPGVINSNPKYFMPFENILLFWAFHPLYGFELHQYISNPCEADKNYTMQSGNWSDPNTWSCQHVPLESEIVIIKNPHKVNVSLGYKAVANILCTEMGAVLDIPAGVLVEFKAN